MRLDGAGRRPSSGTSKARSTSLDGKRRHRPVRHVVGHERRAGGRGRPRPRRPAPRCRGRPARRGRPRRPRRPRRRRRATTAPRVGCRPGARRWRRRRRRRPSRPSTATSHSRTASGASAPARATPRCSRSSGSRSSRPALVRRGGVGAGQEHVADLEEADAGAAAGGVGGDRLDQAGQQGRAQDRLLGDQRVAQLDASGGKPQRGQGAGGEERQRHDLGQPAAGEQPAHLAAAALDRREAARAATVASSRRGMRA